jgi:hypothetical protein
MSIPVLKYRVDRPLLKPQAEFCPQPLLPWQGWRCTGGRKPFAAFGALAVRGRTELLPVIPKICDLCHQQHLEKPASLYWAWVRADGRRKAYKQRVCAACMQEHYVKLIASSFEPVLICPACGISTVDDMDAVYLTYCLPGMPKGQAEMPLCGPCAVEVRNKALEGARELEDRGVGVGGPQPTAQGAAGGPWAAIGLRYE